MDYLRSAGSQERIVTNQDIRYLMDAEETIMVGTEKRSLRWKMTDGQREYMNGKNQDEK